MPCYKPLKGWRSRAVNPDSGKRGVVFQRNLGLVDLPVEVPCGQCSGCRLERSRQWAVRCMHEASLHRDNIFVTLTYDNEHLPEDRSLNHRHFQLFMKRLRVEADRKQNRSGIRFYMCGEYGETYGRPHYHACLFNYDLEDKQLWKVERDNRLYTSDFLSTIWGMGFCSVGNVTFQSAAYVARYVMKKRTGPQAEEHYSWIDPDTGEIHQRRPEYCRPSNRSGIGAGWYDKFKSDIYPDDFVVVNGTKASVPRYYAKRYEIEYPDDARLLRARRAVQRRSRADDNTPARLKVREKVHEARMGLLKRTIE